MKQDTPPLSYSRRRVIGGAAAAAVASAFGLISCSKEEPQMATNPKEVTDSVLPIRPFTVNIPNDDLIDLRRRINATRWPDRETVQDSTQGVQLATIQKLAKHWANDYDWRKTEARINAVPNYVTNIDGLDIHFMHIKSKHEDALPLLVAHGWPGSFVELMKLIGPLTDPTAHGGNASDAFHLIIPSMPGYGFSARPTTTGWGPVRIADAYNTLMDRLGYTKWGAQGGDWGAVIVDLMALKTPHGLVGIHTNMPGVIPPAIDQALFKGDPPPAGLSPEEQRCAEQVATTYKHIGYAVMMGDRPQTLTGLTDSPVGLAAFMLDHDPKSYEMIARSIDGTTEGMTPDDVLDNITLFWLTNTALSSARLYWENKTPYFSSKGVQVPVGVSAFPDELYQAPKSWSEQAYPKLVYYNAPAKGGHFAAWEQPVALSNDIRATFRTLR